MKGKIFLSILQKILWYFEKFYEDFNKILAILVTNCILCRKSINFSEEQKTEKIIKFKKKSYSVWTYVSERPFRDIDWVKW